MGAAQALQRSGDPRAAADTFADLDAPDPAAERWRLQQHASALMAADELDDALAIWRALEALAAEDPTVLATALLGQGTALVALDRSPEALPLLARAESLSTDPASQGWASLARAGALHESGDSDGALAVLLMLVDHPDPEVQLQSRIRRAQAFSAQERWTDALAELAEVGFGALGPGWDATVAETRAAAWIGSGDREQAREEWKHLVRTWPDEEEAQLPAWLGLAALAAVDGQDDQALALANQALSKTQDPAYRAQAEALIRDLRMR